MWGSRDGMLTYCQIEAGRADYFSGRAVAEDTDRRWRHWKPPAELFGDQKPFFNSHAPTSDFIILVEGQADMITLAAWQLPAVAVAGLANQLGLALKLASYPVVYVGLDND